MLIVLSINSTMPSFQAHGDSDEKTVRECLLTKILNQRKQKAKIAEHGKFQVGGDDTNKYRSP